MRLLRQPEFTFEPRAKRLPVGRDVDLQGGTRCPQRVVKISLPSAPNFASCSEKPIHLVPISSLEGAARTLIRQLGAVKLAREVRVEWNSHMQTGAGRADYHSGLISLNPQLVHHPAEIDRTLRHELAHILAQWRARRRRILPHGVEWQQACRDLGISGEKRCHSLPFPAKRLAHRYLYRCPNCQRDFPRVRRIKRAVACLACCRKHNGGDFDVRFRLKLVRL
jgi:SprT protein